MQRIFDRLWHKVLRQPYRAVCTVDAGEGPTVVLLHGIGSSSKAWRHVVKLLVPTHRVLVLDLLGFGIAPKPDWLDYTVDDHAHAVLATLKKRHVEGSVVLVGHSMGCLIAVHIARLEPGLVDRLVLYEMPLYTEAPSLKRYTMLRRLYFAVYKQVLKHPKYTPSNARMIQKLAARLAGGFEITRKTWTPFVKSLRNTVMTQTTAEDIKQLKLPMDIIYGSRDIVVLRGAARAVFEDTTHITTHVIASRHAISLSASAFIAERVDEKPLVEATPSKKRKLRKRLSARKSA